MITLQDSSGYLLLTPFPQDAISHGAKIKTAGTLKLMCGFDSQLQLLPTDVICSVPYSMGPPAFSLSIIKRRHRHDLRVIDKEQVVLTQPF